MTRKNDVHSDVILQMSHVNLHKLTKVEKLTHSKNAQLFLNGKLNTDGDTEGSFNVSNLRRSVISSEKKTTPSLYISKSIACTGVKQWTFSNIFLFLYSTKLFANLCGAQMSKL